MNNRKFIIGLTGGFASGKSTVAEILKERGFEIIDADIVARDIVKPGSEALAKIVSRWGQQILKDDGSLDREKLANIIFNDDNERYELERIQHPLIIQKMLELAYNSVKDIVIWVAPLLFESGLDKQCDIVVTLVAPEDIRIRRAMEKHNMSHEMAEARIKAQLKDIEKVLMSDIVIDTDCPEEELNFKVDEMVEQIYKIIEEERNIA